MLPYAINGSTMPELPSPDRSSENVIVQDAGGSANPLNTPFSEACFSQLVSDSAHSYIDFDFSGETILGTSQAKDTGTYQDSLVSRFQCWIEASVAVLLKSVLSFPTEPLVD